MRNIYKHLRYFFLLVFTVFSLSPVPNAFPQAAVPQSIFYPAVIKALTIHPDNPLMFDFMIDTGSSGFKGDVLSAETTKLVKYFLAALAIPKEDLWVNLSPFESDRIVPDQFGKTDMGRDLLAQDYILKQRVASLINPQTLTGKVFWERIYQESKIRYGTTEIPIQTFNKVWIVPDRMIVYQNGNQAFVVESRLKVMMEEDLKAIRHSADGQNNLSGEIFRELILPVIEQEVNEGEMFAPLRQIYQSLIFANWYKQTFRAGLLGRYYADTKKISGIDSNNHHSLNQIYQQYLELYRKGAYSFIKEDYDESSRQMIPRKYFSGGFSAGNKNATVASAAASLTLQQKLALASAHGNVVTSRYEFQMVSEEKGQNEEEDPALLLEDLDHFTTDETLGTDIPVLVVVKSAQEGQWEKRKKMYLRYKEQRIAMHRRTKANKGGFVAATTIGAAGFTLEDLKENNSWMQQVVEPKGVAVNEQYLIVGGMDSILIYSPEGTFIKEIKNPLFSSLHTIQFSPFDPGRILVASTGTELIFEYDVEEGREVWRWDPWVHGFGWAPDGTLLDDAIRQHLDSIVGLAAEQMSLQINGSFYDVQNPEYIYIVSFARGEILRVNRQSGEAQTIQKGLRNPHGFLKTSHGWMMTDTLAGRVVWADDAQKLSHVLDFSKVSKAEPELDGVEWLQFTHHLTNGVYITIDSIRNGIWLFDLNRKLKRFIAVNKDFSLQEVLLDPNRYAGNENASPGGVHLGREDDLNILNADAGEVFQEFRLDQFQNNFNGLMPVPMGPPAAASLPGFSHLHSASELHLSQK